MDNVTSATFWGSMTVVTSAIGATFFMAISHSSEPKHAASATESDVSKIELKLERVVTDVGYHTELLRELKTDVKNLRTEQSDQSKEILEAIRNGN